MSEDTGATDTELPSGSSNRATRRVDSPHESSLMEGFPRVIDLVPQSRWRIALLFLGGVLVIAALEGLYWWMPQVAHLASDGSVEAFDLDGEGSLAVWYSSLLLMLSGCTALLIFSVRRRQVDDYHARYRVWLWAALTWFLLSMDETASLHEGFKELMVLATGTRIYGDGSVWWVMTYGLLLGTIGSLLWFEMRSSWGARAAFALVGGSWLLAIVAQLEWLPGVKVTPSIMIEEGAEMLGDLLLLLSMGLHARFTLRNAGKLLPVDEARRVRKSKAAAKAEAPPAPSAASKTSRPAPVKQPSSPAPQSAAAKDETKRVDPPAAEQPQPHRKLSKSEKRALRKQRRRESAES